MAEVKMVLIKHKSNKGMGERKCAEVEWEKGGSWKRDWELVKKGEGKKAKALTPEQKLEKENAKKELEDARAEYKTELGKEVSKNKKNDLVWIKEKIAESKSEVKQTPTPQSDGNEIVADVEADAVSKEEE